MKSQDCPLTISFVISAKTNRPNTTMSINKRLNPMNNQISASSYLSRKSLILPEDHEKNTDMCCHVHDRKRLREATLPFLSFLFSDLKLLGSDRDGILLPYNSTTGRGFPLLSLRAILDNQRFTALFYGACSHYWQCHDTRHYLTTIWAFAFNLFVRMRINMKQFSTFLALYLVFHL